MMELLDGQEDSYYQCNGSHSNEYWEVCQSLCNVSEYDVRGCIFQPMEEETVKEGPVKEGHVIAVEIYESLVKESVDRLHQSQDVLNGIKGEGGVGSKRKRNALKEEECLLFKSRQNELQNQLLKRYLEISARTKVIYDLYYDSPNDKETRINLRTINAPELDKLKKEQEAISEWNEVVDNMKEGEMLPVYPITRK